MALKKREFPQRERQKSSVGASLGNAWKRV